eukprot:Rmarinus@m.26304
MVESRLEVTDELSLVESYGVTVRLADTRKIANAPETKIVAEVLRNTLQNAKIVVERPKDLDATFTEAHVTFSKASDYEASLSSLKEGQTLNHHGLDLVVQSCAPGQAESADDLIAASQKQYMTPSALKYGGTKPSFELLAPGKRPDTVMVRGLPHKWFAADEKKADLATVRRFFEKLCQKLLLEQSVYVRDICLVDSRKDDPILAKLSLDFDVYVQFFTHAAFCAVLRALCGKALSQREAKRPCRYHVDYDQTSFFYRRNHNAPSSSSRAPRTESHASSKDGSWKRKSLESARKDDEEASSSPKRVRFG